jgi:hypothetical protein
VDLVKVDIAGLQGAVTPPPPARSTSFNAAQMIGPAVAGLLVAKEGIRWAFLLKQGIQPVNFLVGERGRRTPNSAFF